MVMTLKFRMMKNAILLFLIFGLFACNSDENIGFDVPVEFRKDLSFRPVPGGAVMNYYLPRNPEVAGIRVRYNDVRGMEMVLSGTYLVLMKNGRMYRHWLLFLTIEVKSLVQWSLRSTRRIRPQYLFLII